MLRCGYCGSLNHTSIQHFKKEWKEYENKIVSIELKK